MINLTLVAGLGNQMFEYAYARALSEEFNDPDIVINQYYNKIYKIYCVANGSTSDIVDISLAKFALNPNVHWRKPITGYSAAISKIVPGAMIRYGILNPNMDAEKYKKQTAKGKFHFLDKGYTYYKHENCKRNNKSVYGWFGSEMFFDKIRPIILKEFQFKEEPTENKNKEMIEELSSCNSVCIHIRRGDIVNTKYEKIFYKAGEEYYKMGVEYVLNHTTNPVFYVFSNNHNDIEWIKKNYNFEVPVKYVDLNNPGFEDLRLMYHCKHFIIAQSTFSWWGSYMSQNDNKIVIAPEAKVPAWLKDADMNGWYRKDMIRFPSETEEANK